MTKPIIVVKMPRKLLCHSSIRILNKMFNFLQLALLYISFWSPITIVTSDWPHTFLQPGCFCLAYHAFFVNRLQL